MTRVYIIHGWTYKLDKWAKVCTQLKQRDIEPVLLKVPGLTDPSSNVWDIDGYIDWLNGKLKDFVKPIVVGHSNGGRIALTFVQKFPDRLGNLILIDSGGIAHNEAKAAAKLKTLKFIAKAGKPIARLPGAKKVFYKVIGARDYYEAPENMKQTMRNMLAADQKIDFNTIKVPVTIIWGRDDTITPLDDGKKLHESIAGSSMHIINEARHSPFWSHPGEVADIIAKAVKGS